MTVVDESLAERLAALKDMVPPQQRKFLSNTFSTASSWITSSLRFSGKTLWVVSTSALLLGVPWALAFAEEQQLAEMEREMKMQQSANEVRFVSSLLPFSFIFSVFLLFFCAICSRLLLSRRPG